jgi:hypothetical protein
MSTQPPPSRTANFHLPLKVSIVFVKEMTSTIKMKETGKTVSYDNTSDIFMM